jgi:serine/threonine protein kinase
MTTVNTLIDELSTLSINMPSITKEVSYEGSNESSKQTIESSIQSAYPLYIIEILPSIIKYNYIHISNMKTNIIYSKNPSKNASITLDDYSKSYRDYYDKLQNKDNKQYYFLKIRYRHNNNGKYNYVGNKYMYDFFKKIPHDIALSPVYFEELKEYEIALFDYYQYDLVEYILSNGKLSEKNSIVIFKQLISFIHCLHNNNIIHCDLKPENIMISNIDTFDIKVTDFETCLLLSDKNEVKQLTSHRGTRDYYPPETIMYYKFSTKTDVWSIGVILYIMITGIPPVDEKMIMTKYMKYGSSYLYDKIYFSKTAMTNKTYNIIKKIFTSPKTRISINELSKFYN